MSEFHSLSDNLFIAGELSAAKAPMAGNREIQKKFSIATTRTNSTVKLSFKVTAKSIQDRYKKIQDASDRKNQADRSLSRVGGEIRELDGLLGLITETQNDLNREKKAQIAFQEEKEAIKEQIGRDLVAESLRRKLNSPSEDEEDEEDRREDLGSFRKKKLKSIPGSRGSGRGTGVVWGCDEGSGHSARCYGEGRSGF